MDLNRLTCAYINIRDAKSSLKKKYDEQSAELNEQMKLIADKMDSLLADMGTESARTDGGTCFRKIVHSSSVEDFDEFFKAMTITALEDADIDPLDPLVMNVVDTILDSGPLSLMNRSVSKTKVADHVTEHGQPPAGIHYAQSFEIQVNRPRR